jgi:hypothetical protein
MDPVIIKNIKIGGLGTLISTISTFLSYNRPVKWIIDGATNTEKDLIDSLLKIFGIPPSRLAMEYTDDRQPPRTEVLDCFKFFSPYIETTHITYKNNMYRIRTTNNDRNRPCVGVALYDKRKYPGALEHMPFDRSTWPDKKYEWPERKMWPIDVYQKLLTVLINSGYDIIMFDRCDFDISDKIFFLNEYCDFVIGYEGGLHHLAHILNIPSIVLPWSNPLLEKNLHRLNIHGLHLDNKTWIFDNISDAILLNPTKLMKIRNKLVKEKGNNIFLNHKIGMSHELNYLKIHYDDAEPKKVEPCNWFSNFEKKQLHDYLLEKKIAGVKDFYWF